MIKQIPITTLSAVGLLTILAPGATKADTTTTTGEVVTVTSGDTLTYRVNDRLPVARQRKVQIRLYGVDAPEMGQPHGEQARRFVADRLLGKRITVKPAGKGKESSGPVVARVYLGKGCVNEWLLKNGLAWWDRRQGSDKKLEGMENEAKEAKKGLWADPKPMAPWEWRTKERATYAKCLKRCTQRNAMRPVAAAVVLFDCRKSCAPKQTTRGPSTRSRSVRKIARRTRRSRRRVVKRTRARSKAKGKDAPVEVEVLRGDKVDLRKLRPTADSKQ